VAAGYRVSDSGTVVMLEPTARHEHIRRIVGTTAATSTSIEALIKEILNQLR
jgi:hypothetical protein